MVGTLAASPVVPDAPEPVPGDAAPEAAVLGVVGPEALAAADPELLLAAADPEAVLPAAGPAPISGTSFS
jgi:hypothetical protein